MFRQKDRGVIMEVMNIQNANQLVALAKENGVKPMAWISFCGWINEVWFRGELTWEQHSMIKDKAWELTTALDDHAEYLFGLVKFAYDNGELTW